MQCSYSVTGLLHRKILSTIDVLGKDMIQFWLKRCPGAWLKRNEKKFYSDLVHFLDNCLFHFFEVYCECHSIVGKKVSQLAYEAVSFAFPCGCLVA
jgi:hypothetical protein